MNLSRIHRLLKLISLLQAGRGYNVDSLASACGVSRRTVFRDIDVLRDTGLPLVFDDLQQRYSIPGAHFLPPTNFTHEEALSLLVLCHDLGDHTQLPFFTPARSAVLKLEGSLPTKLRTRLKATADAIQIEMPPVNQLHGQQPIYEQLLEAIVSRHCVRIQYKSPAESGKIKTRLNPYRLLFRRRSWYVIGRSSIHRSTRTFNIGRILDLEPLEDKFQIPRGFSTNRYLRNAWNLIPEQGADSDVVIRFSKHVAQNVAEVTWHKTQQLTNNKNGSLDFKVTVSGLGEICWWVLGYGAEAEVINPPKLRKMVVEHASRLAELYKDT